MIHILLLLLKIIGITLLSLLGLIVLVVLTVLFVPIRYSLRVEADENKDEQSSFARRTLLAGDTDFDSGEALDERSMIAGVKVRARISWLLHLLHTEAVYDGVFGAVVRLFGIPIKRIPAPEETHSKKAKRKKKKPTSKKAAKQNKEAQSADEKPDSGAEAKSSVEAAQTVSESENRPGSKETYADEIKRSAQTKSLPKAVQSEGDKQAEEGGNPQADDDNADQENEKEAKMSFFQKLAQFFKAVRAFFSKILYTIRNICGKIEKIKELIGYYFTVLKSEEGQHTFALLKRELGRLLKHIAPTKLNGSLTIGTDDPAVTGQIIAIVSMFYPIYGNNVSITPDFDEKCVRGSLYLKGRIRIITLIRIAWRVYFDKDMKKFLHMLKREENEA